MHILHNHLWQYWNHLHLNNPCLSHIRAPARGSSSTRSLTRPNLLRSFPVADPVCQSFITFLLIPKTVRYIANAIDDAVSVPMLVSVDMHGGSYLTHLSVQCVAASVTSEVEALHCSLTLGHLGREAQFLPLLSNTLLVLFFGSDQLLPRKEMTEWYDWRASYLWTCLLFKLLKYLDRLPKLSGHLHMWLSIQSFFSETSSRWLET